jgi:hypothetical protein
MFDFINDDHITVPFTRLDSNYIMPGWFRKIIDDLCEYYALEGYSYYRITRDARPMLDEYLKKRGFEFEYFKLTELNHDYVSPFGTQVNSVPEGYVFKSNETLTSHILKAKE